MKIKLIIGLLVITALFAGGYYLYHYYYVKTLMLSEIVGHTDNDIVNFVVNLGDFDTGLTRHDLSNLKSKKNYWLNRIKEVETIADNELQLQANAKLLSDMMEDESMSKVCRIISEKGLGFAGKLFEMMN